MKKYIWHIFIIITVLFVYIVYVLNSNLANDNDNRELEKCTSYYTLMKWREQETIFNNGSTLLTNMIVVDENNNSSLFSEKIGNSDKLIIRFSALSCDICLEEELKLIESYMHRIGLDNIILLGSKYDIRSLKVQNNKLPFKLTMYMTDDTGIIFEQTHSNLFLFVMDKDLIVKDFFIPEKTLPKLSETYYETICSKYWEIKQ